MNVLPFKIPDELQKVAQRFSSAGYQCWLVGGAVRDMLRGEKAKDFDLATDAPPLTVRSLFRRTAAYGIKHGTITILTKSFAFETTTFRTEGTYTDGRKPDEVAFSNDIRDDLTRRDFTINAIAWNLSKHCLLDPHGGQEDLKNRIIRAIGNPSERIREDYLRSLRAARFAAQLNFTIHPETEQAMQSFCSGITVLSSERIWEEFKKILMSPNPSFAWRILQRTKLLHKLIPEFFKEESKEIKEDFDRALLSCDAAPSDNFPVRTAAFLEGFRNIYLEPNYSGLLSRLKASNSEKDSIVRLLQYSPRICKLEKKNAALRRFISEVGVDIIENLIILRISMAQDTDSLCRNEIRELKERIKTILEENPPLHIRDLNINGQILMKEFSISPGPSIGIILEALLEKVLENPTLNQRDLLLKETRTFIRDNNL